LVMTQDWPLRRGRDRGGGGFQDTDRAGKLKIWETEKLTSRPATLPTGISDFQDFRFSPLHLPPSKSCRLGPEGVWWGTGNVLNGRFILKTGPLGLTNISRD
jgi:hypothetical protein